MFRRWIKENAVLLSIPAIALLLGAIMFPILPESIPMQWNGLSVNWYAPKAAIFLIPVLAILVLLCLKPIFMLFFNRFLIYSSKLSNLLLTCILFLLFSCECYMILYCFGFRWRLDVILIIESAVFLILFVSYFIKQCKTQHKKK